MPAPYEEPKPSPEDRNQDAENQPAKADDERQDLEISRTLAQVSHYRGPIPPAEEFARYEEIYPGSAERLFSMAEKEQDSTIKFRYSSLAATTIVAIASIIAIALILTSYPESIVLVALAITYALPAITDFIRGIVESQLSRKERELEIQIRKDNHELDMIAAKKQLELPASSVESVTQRARRLESTSESAESRESNL